MAHFRKPDGIDRREWVSSLNQWDIPALFGEDPMGTTPMHVKLEKLGGRGTNRLVAAHCAAAIAATGLGMMGHHDVRVSSHRKHRIAPMCAYGVCVIPLSDKKAGVLVPAFAPRSIGSPEATAAGWRTPDSSGDHTSMVPRWALAQVAFVTALMDPAWVGVAAISPYFTVTRYITPIDRDQAIAMTRRAAEWFRDHLSPHTQDDEPPRLGEIPRLILDEPVAPATGEVRGLMAELAGLEAEQQRRQSRIDDVQADLIARLGRARRFVDPHSGAVLGEVMQDPARWTVLNPSISGKDLQTLRHLAAETPGAVRFQVHDAVTR